MKPFYRCLLWTLCFTSIASAKSPTIVAGGLGKKLNSYCETKSHLGFTGTVLIAKDGKVVFHKGYGLANREQDLPNGPETLFEIASLAKQFTAAAILALEDDGILSTDDSIAKYLPDVPDSYREVTIFHLLTHTGGLPRGGSGRGTDLSAAVHEYLAKPPTSPPGKRYSYSNGGYALLAGIIESVSGKAFVDYCHERLFQPAELQQTGFCGESFPNANLALGYVADSKAGRLPQQDPYPPQDVFGYEYRGMGGVISSTTDLYRWVLALQGEGVLSSTAKQKFFQPFRSNHACGWEVFTFPEGQRCIGHGGSVQGYVCKLWMFPDDDCVIIVLTNHSKFNHRILNELKWMLFDEAPDDSQLAQGGRRPHRTGLARAPLAPPVQLEEKYLESLAGVYACEAIPGLALRVRTKSGELHVDLFCQKIPSSPVERFSQEAELAKKMVLGITKRDTTLLAEYMHPRIPASWPETMRKYIWPTHEGRWGELDDIELIYAGSAKVGQEAWVFVWQQLHHKQGDCISYVAFRPEQKLQLLVLDTNRSLCRNGVFLPRSKSKFTPKEPVNNASITVGANSGVVLETGWTKLVFSPKRQGGR